MRNALNRRKACGLFRAALILGLGFTDVDAASFLFSWKASTDPSVTVNGQVVECHDEDESGTTVFVSCFINAAGR
jgi:hypothetical protein